MSINLLFLKPPSLHCYKCIFWILFWSMYWKFHKCIFPTPSPQVSLAAIIWIVPQSKIPTNAGLNHNHIPFHLFGLLPLWYLHISVNNDSCCSQNTEKIVLVLELDRGQLALTPYSIVFFHVHIHCTHFSIKQFYRKNYAVDSW